MYVIKPERELPVIISEWPNDLIRERYDLIGYTRLGNSFVLVGNKMSTTEEREDSLEEAQSLESVKEQEDSTGVVVKPEYTLESIFAA